MADEPSVDLWARWRGGDAQAADELFGRYTARMVALARRRLSAKLSRRIDPEDVVQSAYRSFCGAARDDRFVLERSGDLWRLPASITLHKLHHHVERHRAAKRSVEKERGFSSESSLAALGAGAAARDPSPDEAAALVEEVEHLMRGLPPLGRRMVELRLQGNRIEEIAAETDRSERWVRRVLGEVRDRLDRRARESADG
jgi:RNA polymerase sigma-70 factor (ECF subfamily)